MKQDVEHKITPCKVCKAGKHTFIPAEWKVKPTSQTCTLFVCQHCLMPADQADREVMGCLHGDEVKAKKLKEEVPAKA